MRHLIVDACIARNLLDISAYAWPGYVNARVNQIPRVSGQVTGWSSLMKGSPLTSAMMNVLVSSPASRYIAMFHVPFNFRVSSLSLNFSGEGFVKKSYWLELYYL